MQWSLVMGHVAHLAQLEATYGKDDLIPYKHIDITSEMYPSHLG
jgi:hypothetical protein